MFKPAADNSVHKDSRLFERYVDPTGEFTNRELGFSEWYLKHKIQLRQGLTVFLIVVCVVLGGYSLYRVIEYAFYGYWHDEALRSNLTNQGVALNTVKKEVAATPIQIETIAVLPSSPGKADYLAYMNNPNDRWAARVFYTFSWSGGETAVADTWLWPGQRSGLGVLGVATDAIPGDARVTIKNIEWRRLDNRTYLDPAQFVTERLQFTVDEMVFVPANPNAGTSVHTISFILKNETAFGYWQVPFTAIFKKGEVIVGSKQFIVDSFAAESIQKIDLTSLVDSLDLDTVEVYANLNLFDEDNYLPLKK